MPGVPHVTAWATYDTEQGLLRIENGLLGRSRDAVQRRADRYQSMTKRNTRVVPVRIELDTGVPR